MGKLLERIIFNSLLPTVKETGDQRWILLIQWSSGRGSRAASKIHISHDVRNAFSSVQRQHVVSQINAPMYIQLIIRDYFVDKRTLYGIKLGPVEYSVHIWNVISYSFWPCWRYDSCDSRQIYLICCLGMWEFAEHKTEIVIVSSRKLKEVEKFREGKQMIGVQAAMTSWSID